MRQGNVHCVQPAALFLPATGNYLLLILFSESNLVSSPVSPKLAHKTLPPRGGGSVVKIGSTSRLHPPPLIPEQGVRLLDRVSFWPRGGSVISSVPFGQGRENRLFAWPASGAPNGLDAGGRRPWAGRG